MHLTAVFTTLTVLVTSALESLGATLHTIQKFKGETTGHYIVMLEPSFNKSTIELISGLTHTWDGGINGFAGHFDDEAIEELKVNPHVKSITEDGIMHTFASVTQIDAPWGLARLGSISRQASQSIACASNYSYTYDSSGGAGVDIYIVDTGVLTTHVDFGGRARWGATFGGYPDADGNGHGTHCAGAAAGTQFGVAKQASIIAVKAFSDEGFGFMSDIISGLDWVQQQVSSTGRPSVVLIASGGPASTPLDSAVESLTSAGIHVAAAAGDFEADAGDTSPARVPSAVTVAATNIRDMRAPFSSFGSVVDVYAPGMDILSDWIGSDTATECRSGTSASASYVSGLIAYFIALDGNISPADMSSKIQAFAINITVEGIAIAHNAPPVT